MADDGPLQPADLTCESFWQVSSGRKAQEEVASLRSSLADTKAQSKEASQQLEAERSACKPLLEARVAQFDISSYTTWYMEPMVCKQVEDVGSTADDAASSCLAHAYLRRLLALRMLLD